MKQKTPFPKLTHSQINKILKSIPFEDLATIRQIDKFFTQKRGYVFRMPQPGSPVILLVSGGLDSIILWAVLLKTYRLNVYPLYIHRDKVRFSPFPDPEIRSLNYFNSLYAKKYSQTFHPIYKLHASFRNNRNLATISQSTPKNPAYLLDHIQTSPSHQPIIHSEINGGATILALIATQYRELLWARDSTLINTIFNATVGHDSRSTKSQTLTNLRSTMLVLCTSLNNYHIQFTSIATEPQLNHYLQKHQFIKWASHNHIPLSKTWTCPAKQLLHCGVCINCQHRRLQFLKSGVNDPTLYATNFRQIAKILLHKLYYHAKLKIDEKILLKTHFHTY